MLFFYSILFFTPEKFQEQQSTILELNSKIEQMRSKFSIRIDGLAKKRQEESEYNQINMEKLNRFLAEEFKNLRQQNDNIIDSIEKNASDIHSIKKNLSDIHSIKKNVSDIHSKNVSIEIWMKTIENKLDFFIT